MTWLTFLSLSANRLASVPRDVGRLTALMYLYLADNQLAAVPREIGRLEKLVWLTVSRTRSLGSV